MLLLPIAATEIPSLDSTLLITVAIAANNLGVLFDNEPPVIESVFVDVCLEEDVLGVPTLLGNYAEALACFQLR